MYGSSSPSYILQFVWFIFRCFLWSIRSFLVLDLEIGEKMYKNYHIFYKNVKIVIFCSSRSFIQLICIENMQMEDRSWMYQSGDVLAHFKGVSALLEAVTQHATREKEEAIYCPCKLCSNNVMYLYKDREIIHEQWFGVVFWIITSSGASMMRHNKG
jgi:hypothetical protein